MWTPVRAKQRTEHSRWVKTGHSPANLPSRPLEAQALTAGPPFPNAGFQSSLFLLIETQCDNDKKAKDALTLTSFESFLPVTCF